ncbi:MAG: hypothetical protein V3S39_07385 [Thermodesulfobacteriota bacterium]
MLVVSLTVSLSSRAQPWAAEKVRFATPLKLYAPHAMPVLTAEEKGFWKKTGVDA